jgi:hypothetical protein
MPREAAWKPTDAFPGPPDWARAHRAATIAAATGCTLKEAAATVAALPLRRSDFYGSSVEFADYLRDERPWLRAPEGEIVPLTGALGWSPEHEDASAAFCPDCRGPFLEPDAAAAGFAHRIPEPLVLYRIGLPPLLESPARPRPDCPKCGDGIDARSGLYCPKCAASGFDGRLARQRAIAGLPPPYRPPAPPPSRAYRPARPRPAPAGSKVGRRWRDLAWSKPPPPIPPPPRRPA